MLDATKKRPLRASLHACALPALSSHCAVACLPCRSFLPRLSALHAASRFSDAAASFERAAWLAQAHERDDVAAAEYEAGATAAKTAAMARGGARRDGGGRDGF
jgi:hypothetical protein